MSDDGVMDHHELAREVLRRRGYLPGKEGGYVLRSIRPAVLASFVTYRNTPAVQLLIEPAPGMRHPVAIIAANQPKVLDAALGALEAGG